METIQDLYRRARQCGKTPADAVALARCGVSIWPRTGHIGPLFSRTERTLKEYRFIEGAERLGWRVVGFADEVLLKSSRVYARDVNRGWYCDAHESEVYRGAVLQIPGRGGKPQFLAGYADPYNAGSFLISCDIHDDDVDAARAADRIAENFAEDAREHDEAWSALSLAVENAREARNAAREALEDVRALETCDSPRVRKTIKAAWCDAWSEYRDALGKQIEAMDNGKRYGVTLADF
jgi:hypothetical protein